MRKVRGIDWNIALHKIRDVAEVNIIAEEYSYEAACERWGFLGSRTIARLIADGQGINPPRERTNLSFVSDGSRIVALRLSDCWQNVIHDMAIILFGVIHEATGLNVRHMPFVLHRAISSLGTVKL